MDDRNNIFFDDELDFEPVPSSEIVSSEVKNESIKHKIFIGTSKILPIIAFVFVSILGVYIFVNNVKADVINLIKIESNQKVGYINNSGSEVVKPKYLYGSDFHSGYAVVKNYNNLYGIINGRGNNEIQFGNIFSANLYGNRYIVSKFTDKGLKMGLLDSHLNEVTRFKYDNITYSKSGIFMYTIDDKMGILNNDGTEIYSYKVDEVDDKNISIEISTLTNNEKSMYAKVKINSSSTIINLQTGKEVYKYTLDDIRVLDNNVFYIKKEDENNRYFIIKDDKVVYETNLYKRIRVEDVNSDVAIGIKEDATIDYINLLTREKINTNDNVKYTYSDGIVLEESYDFISKKNEYTVITPSKVIGKFTDVVPVDDTYVNGYMKIYTDNKKYSFIDKRGNVITDKEFEYVSDFNKNGYAIVSNNNQYGVLDSQGREVLNTKYDEIIFLDDTLFSNLNDKLFIYKENNKYGIINANKKVVVKNIYDKFDIITTKYPIIKAIYNEDSILVNLKTYRDLSIDSTGNIQIYDEYIVSDDNYYNYDGELIYSIGG